LPTPICVLHVPSTPPGVVEHLSRRDAVAAAAPYAPRVIAALALRRRPDSRFDIGDWVLALVMVVGLFAIGTRGKYLSWPNIEVILRLAGIPAILAVGLHQTIVLGGIDLSVEGVAALCIVFVGFLLKNTVNSNDVGLLILPIVLAIGGSAGIVTGLVHTKLRIPSLATKISGHPSPSISPMATPRLFPAGFATPALRETSVNVPSRLLWYSNAGVPSNNCGSQYMR